MEIEKSRDGETFRYETESGFRVETLNAVLPVFDCQFKSFNWYDFNPPSPTTYQDFVYNGFDAKPIYQYVAIPWTADGSAVYLDLSAPSATNPLTYVAIPSFCDATVVADRIKDFRRYLGKRDNRIVDHKRRQSPLMAGEEYLVSRCNQQRTEASAKDHIIHLEFLTLSRDHSDANLFFAAVHKLKRFGWRKWQNLSSSNRALDILKCFSRSGNWCLSFAVVFSQMN